jgi:hypothetical protein
MATKRESAVAADSRRIVARHAYLAPYNAFTSRVSAAWLSARE